jgi:hypothetical protein
MRKNLIRLISILVVMLVNILPANAQGEVRLQALEVDFWPEYDRPSMLVIYTAELDPTVRLPADLTFRIPASVGEPHAVAVGENRDRLFTATYQRQVDGEWAWITFNTALPVIRLEYYDVSLNQQTVMRDYQFQWPGDYAVNVLNLQVQQPVDSTDMRISPSLGNGLLGSDGLVYYTGEFGPLRQNQAFQLSVSYAKESSTLSLAVVDIEAGVTSSTNIPGRVTLMSLLPWLLGSFGLLLIIGAVIWYWRSGQQREGVFAQTRRGKRAASKTDVESKQTGKAVFCHQCGRRANPGDRFCRTCGERLRTG